MVCPLGSARMAALARPLAPGSVSRTLTEEVGHQKLAAQYVSWELREADEPNLLDEEDMHIFGLRPMTDPLDLVCCHACRKPVKASRFSAHEELCKSLSSRADIIPEVDRLVVNKKPSRKAKKKMLTAPTNKTASLRETQKLESANSNQIAATEYHVDKKIQMAKHTEVERKTHLNWTQKVKGSRVSPCSENVAKCPSKHSKRVAAENPLNPGTESLCTATAKVPPYIPAPLATKIYYSQRNHRLRRAISHMFYGESNKEFSPDASHSQVPPVNAVPMQNPYPSTFCNDQVINQQEGSHFVPLGQTTEQMLVASSELYSGNVGGFALSTDVEYQQFSVNNTVGPHYMKTSYSFAGKAGNSLCTVPQTNASFPVVQES